MIKENRKIELEKLQQEHDEVVTNLNIQNTKYKTELDELTKFKANKKKMETEMEDLRKTIIENEEEYKKTIYNMEKKMLQDKTKLRKEMLQKVNEVVLNFQKVADQQIAETTKRAIQENIIINSQLKKMSEKTVSLLSENQMLQQRNEKLKTANVLLAEIEKIIGKKNKTNQQIMKWIIEQKKSTIY
jgi:transketolase